jgi:hypothetical protein
MDLLTTKITRLYNLSISYSLQEYNDLIKQCVDLYEMSAVVFLYDNMKYHKINPTKNTFQLINKLHSKTCNENNLIVIKDNGLRKLKPRRRIHKIMKGYNYSNALKNVELVKSYIMIHHEIRQYNKIKLAKNISSNCDVTFAEARYIITNLKRTKFLTDDINTNKTIIDFFNI